VAGGQRGAEHPPNPAQVAAQPELAHGPQAVEGGDRYAAAGGQQPDGDRQVEARAVLGEVRGRQRHGDAAVGPVEAGVAEGGTDAVAGLEHGGVAEPHHGDRGEPAADVDLDPHRVGDQADQRGGRQPGEHRSMDSLGWWCCLAVARRRGALHAAGRP
jgi:hypothetical protein